jgi:hypothetical protein
MFNFFKSRQEFVEKTMEEIKEADKVIPGKRIEETDQSIPVYQIGRTGDGRITLRIGDGHTHSTLTMSQTAVVRLIRMLEVAVEED